MRFKADGRPNTNPAVPVKIVAFLRVNPTSTATFTTNSIIDNKELNAAKLNPKKKRIENMPPPDIVANN